MYEDTLTLDDDVAAALERLVIPRRKPKGHC